MYGFGLLLCAFLASSLPADSDTGSLVSQLGASRFADREAAARALEALGRDAMGPLRAARFDQDPEVRSRAAELLDRIERALLAQPTAVVLDFTDRPLSEVIEALAARTGMPLLLDPDENDKWANMRVTLSAQKPVPFWTAVDRLSAASPRLRAGLGPPLSAGRGGSPSVLFFDPGDRARPPAPVSDAGPFRVKVLSLHYQRDRMLDVNPGAPEGQASGEQFQARLQVLAEPRLMIGQAGPPRLLEAIDDAGQSLRMPPHVGELEELQGFADFGQSGTIQFPLVLRYPERPGRTIRRLRGVVPVTVAARKPDPIEVTLAGSAGKTFLGSDASLVVREIKSDPNEPRITLMFSLQSRGEPREALVMPLGRRARMYGLGAEFSEQQFEVLDSRGKPFILLMQDASPEADAVRVTLVLAPADGASTPAKLRYFGLTRGTADVAFAFQDIPMP